MALALTAERLAAVYSMLRAYPPFSRWSLPPAESVKFRVMKTDKWHADWDIDKRERHHIRVSGKTHGHISSLIASMAHEMIHVRQRVAGTETHGVEHNREFKRLGLQVCRAFGFDPGQF